MDPDKPNKPGDSAFKQQRIKSWNITMSKKSLSLFYISCGVTFLLIGSLIVVESNKVIEHKLRYDNLDECKAHWLSPSICTLKLNLPEKMTSPIFVYYEISNMYQNHRRYNKNRDSLQLMGNTRSKSDISQDCSPVKTMGQLGLVIDSTVLSPQSVANPCGLIAKSVFNDTYTISPSDTSARPVDISFKDISWKIDREEKFKKNDHPEVQWLDVKDGIW